MARLEPAPWPRGSKRTLSRTWHRQGQNSYFALALLENYTRRIARGARRSIPRSTVTPNNFETRYVSVYRSTRIRRAAPGAISNPPHGHLRRQWRRRRSRRPDRCRRSVGGVRGSGRGLRRDIDATPWTNRSPHDETPVPTGCPPRPTPRPAPTCPQRTVKVAGARPRPVMPRVVRSVTSPQGASSAEQPCVTAPT